jgi:catechol 2,3-dioxygenase-like lactoylglutathione lyase family enzyme
MQLTILNYVILLCQDLARMKVFYHEVLGFPVERDWEDWIEMRAGGHLDPQVVEVFIQLIEGRRG